jgi:hypothetical protein
MNKIEGYRFVYRIDRVAHDSVKVQEVSVCFRRDCEQCRTKGPLSHCPHRRFVVSHARATRFFGDRVPKVGDRDARILMFVPRHLAIRRHSALSQWMDDEETFTPYAPYSLQESYRGLDEAHDFIPPFLARNVSRVV